MNNKERLLKYLHKMYRKDNFINYFLEAVDKVIKDVSDEIERMQKLLHFNRLDEKSCEWWERLLGLTTILPSLEDRKAYIRSKWRTSSHNSIDLIKNICSSFENGSVEADFIHVKINLEFGQNSEITLSIGTLLDLIDKVKPAHIPYLLKYVLVFNNKIYSGVGISEVIKSDYDCRKSIKQCVMPNA